MNHDERLKYMRAWLRDLKTIFPEDNKKEIECLSWAIKQCQKNVNKKRSEENRWRI